MASDTAQRSLLPAAASPRGALHTVMTTLRERIESGHYTHGERLPSERVLSEEMGVHRRVVRAAIEQLVKEDIVSRRPHCSPVVEARSNPQHPAVSSGEAPSFSASRLVALVMWHGGAQERAGTAQQRIFWGMNQALGQAGYHAVFLDLGKDIGSEEENAAREAAHLRYVLEHGFGGAVFYAYAYQSNRELVQEVASRIPFVLIDRPLLGVAADFVGIQNHQAMSEAAAYLIGQGHTRIAYVTKAESIAPVQDRLQGYLHAVREASTPEASTPGMQEIVLTTPSTDSHSWTVFDTMFRLPPDERPTAALCFNDYEALRVASHLADLGLSVPNDVSLIGCDDVVNTLPNGVGLTTIAQPYEEIGRIAVRLFLRRIGTPSAPQSYAELPTHMVVRESCIPHQ